MTAQPLHSRAPFEALDHGSVLLDLVVHNGLNLLHCGDVLVVTSVAGVRCGALRMAEAPRQCSVLNGAAFVPSTQVRIQPTGCRAPTSRPDTTWPTWRKSFCRFITPWKDSFGQASILPVAKACEANSFGNPYGSYNGACEAAAAGGASCCACAFKLEISPTEGLSHSCRLQSCNSLGVQQFFLVCSKSWIRTACGVVPVSPLKAFCTEAHRSLLPSQDLVIILASDIPEQAKNRGGPQWASEPTAGWQLEPAIGRVPRAAGRASSASAGNPFKLTLSISGL